MHHNFFKLSAIASICAGLLTACQTTQPLDNTPPQATTLFQEATADFPSADKNLRQWDTATVADLDQDGYPDLLLNDHGYSIRVMWNNAGKYAKPYDLIMGDMHGISVADFDKDGNQEVILSRGGGSGANARNSIIYRVDKERNFTILPDFKEPLAFMRGRTVKFVDADNDGDLDLLNFAFPSSEMKGKSENYIYENNGQGELILNNVLPPIVKKDGQKTLLTDFNDDGNIDLLIFGFDHVRAFKGNGDLTFTQETEVLPEKYQHVTGVAEIDYDNDGDFDIVLTRSRELEAGETFYDKDSKTLAFYWKRGKHQFEPIVMGPIMNIENLQMQWPNKGLYLGESAYQYTDPGETHLGRDIRLVNSDTLGFPDEMDKKGAYLGFVGNNQWTLGFNSWSPASGIIHNVESYPTYEHKAGLSNILLENVDGKYVDVSEKYGFNDLGNSSSVTIADIDNNGFDDIVILQRGNLVNKITASIYFNEQGKSFTKVDNNNIESQELGALGMGIEAVDYNLDGQVDLVQGNERGKWHLYKNISADAQQNKSLTVHVGFSEKAQASALGALVKVTACGNSQIKRVGATGASYALSFNPKVHFGLASCQETAEITVTWPNKESQSLTTEKTSTLATLGQFN